MTIQLIEENGGKLLVVHVSEKLVKADYEHFVPEFERLVKLHGKLCVLFDMTNFHGWTAGALWEDTKFAMHHFSDIDRLAVVGETKWQEGMATFCKPFTKATRKSGSSKMKEKESSVKILFGMKNGADNKLW